ncbi:MAG: penicillin-binding protein 2 [Alphaproteobacteria bacterium]|nr:penicillin-binding protein 2 [Alphaproteobacteria bacterium]
MLSAQRIDENPCRPRHFRPPPPCAPVVPDERAAAFLDSCRSRLVMTAALFAVVFIVVTLRLVDVVLLSGVPVDPRLASNHAAAAAAVALPRPVRADILDRNGRLLATTLDSPSLYADPRQIQNADEATKAIRSVFPQLDVNEVRAKLTSGKSFAWIRRRLTPRQEYDINKLGIPGLYFDHESRRIYPFGDLAAHVIGFCGIDNNGLAGIERALDSTVKSSRDPVQLSIDARVQFILHEELTKVMADFTAKGAAGIIMDVHTGEIIAMVSLPDFDPNHPNRGEAQMTPAEAKDRVFNKVTLGDYELGSVFKTFNTAMALDGGTATLTKTYDAAHDIKIGRFTISDYHGKHRALSVPEIYMYSSNIGSARMALEAGAERQRAFLSKLGLLKPVPIEFDEVAKPHYPNPWREVNTITIAYGHGISVTPLHAITAVSAMVNGGVLHEPTLRKVSPGAEPAGDRVISSKTSEQMRKLMRLVVQYGTAKMAQAPGYVVGGKTGTAEKNVGGHYIEKKLLSDFVGAFPMQDPKYAFLLLVDEPHPNKDSHGYATAGWTVVPATSRLIERIAPILGVPPVDEASPSITQALAIASLQGKKIEDY